MSDLSLHFLNISFAYEKATQPLIHDLSVHFSRGWTGIVGANGVGKTTILKLATGLLTPQQGWIIAPESTIYCQQRTDNPPAQLDALLRTLTGRALKIRDRLGIEDDWLDRWPTLSHGERKRAQIAVALWLEPELLALDEPTNHLDVDALEMLFRALSDYHGIGLLVSHDRLFLDELCHQCLFVDPLDTILRPGGYTKGVQQAELDETSAHRQREQAKNELAKLKQEASKHRGAASQADRKRSKRGLAKKDHDARAKIDAARVTGKDAVAGKRLNQLSGRLSQAQQKLDSLRVKKSYTTGIWLPGEKSQRNTLFDLPGGLLALGEQRCLDYPDLSMQPTDRIALTGANGSGKSTLLRLIVESLNLSPERLTYIPQEIDLGTSQEILTRARNLPHETLGQMLTVVSRLGSRPERLLESDEPSPGEIRKILLATGIACTPHLIIMDEPTNHLDLVSIECLEQALADCPCGLLLVSHDRRFLNTLTDTHWHITENTPNRFHLTG